MSYQLTQQVIERSQSRGLARLALVTLADVAHPDGTGRISVQALADRAGLDRHEVAEAIHVLDLLRELDYKPDGRFSIVLPERAT